MSEVKMPELEHKEKISHEKKVEKIIKGSVKTRRKPLMRKLQDTFLSDDVDSVRSYLIFDVVIPAIKDTISEVVSKGTDMALYGDIRPRNSKQPNTKVSYASYYSSGRKESRKTSVDTKRRFSDYEDVIFESRGEAEEVLSSMFDFLRDYKATTVADLYDLVGITGNGFTDNKYGWTDLTGAKVRRIRDGYVLDLPKAEYIE